MCIAIAISSFLWSVVDNKNVVICMALIVTNYVHDARVHICSQTCSGDCMQTCVYIIIIALAIGK